MGNYIDKGSHTFEDDAENIRTDMAEEPVERETEKEIETEERKTEFINTPQLSVSTASIEPVSDAPESIDYFIYNYKQCMPLKQRQLVKWATAKLALTEELIRTNQLRCVEMQQSLYLEPDDDYLSDDELEDVTFDQQLHSLEKYRLNLVYLLGSLTLNSKHFKSKRKKCNKFKRRNCFAKAHNMTRREQDNESDTSDLSDSSQKSSSNICGNRFPKREPFKVRNC